MVCVNFHVSANVLNSALVYCGPESEMSSYVCRFHLFSIVRHLATFSVGKFIHPSILSKRLVPELIPEQ
jgi:hypothetical protein